MSKDLKIHVFPAEPGWRTIYDVDGKLCVSGAVIAWRIETFLDVDDGGECEAYVRPVSLDDPTPDVWGFLRPDGTVEKPGGHVYETIDEARKHERRYAAATASRGR